MSIGLTSSILNTKVTVGNQERLFTNRIQDPSSMLCPMWSGQDLAGRPVCSDSFYTKNAGCHSSLDRIKVENDLRPKYANYVTISAAGISGEEADYGSPTITREETMSAAVEKMARQTSGPRFGLISSEAIMPTRGSRLDNSASNAYQSADADALNAQRQRAQQNLSIGHNSQNRYNKMNLNPNTHVMYNPSADFSKKGKQGYATLSQL